MFIHSEKEMSMQFKFLLWERVIQHCLQRSDLSESNPLVTPKNPYLSNIVVVRLFGNFGRFQYKSNKVFGQKKNKVA